MLYGLSFWAFAILDNSFKCMDCFRVEEAIYCLVNAPKVPWLCKSGGEGNGANPGKFVNAPLPLEKALEPLSCAVTSQKLWLSSTSLACLRY